jgi:UDP-N-acetylmuramoylalanine--D-glutamate ligase
MLTDVQRRVIGTLAGKRIAVVGIGITNVPLIRFLAKAGAKVVACDVKKEEQLQAEIASFSGLGVDTLLGPGYLDRLSDCDMVFLSPGVNPEQPEIAFARDAGVTFSSEIELVLRLSSAPVIGITGSSGKTTTTTLVGRMLEEDARLHRPERDVLVGGNIGTPLIESVLTVKSEDLIVLELSSFQLKSLRVSPHIAAVLNITPNHLDVHPNMEDYISAKENIVRFQAGDDWAVFGGENDVTERMAMRAHGSVLMFDASGPVERGAFLDGSSLILRRDAGGHCTDTAVMDRSDIKIPGMHNVRNVLAAIAICSALGTEPSAMRDAVSSFGGVEHRLEDAGQVDGVAYVNDSIATTPSRTIAALLAVDRPIVLIAGGYDKNLPFDEMADVALGRVHDVVLLGVTADKIEKAFLEAARWAGSEPPRIVRAADFEEAVDAARAAAVPGDVVLLSPACASYGMFRNFEERGRTFKEIVRRYAEADGEAREE